MSCCVIEQRRAAVESRFAVMGTRAHVVVVDGPPDSLEFATSRIDQLEGLWSRFRASSEVCALNAGGGMPTVVSPETLTLLHRAVEAWRMTNGACDATVLHAMEAAGYHGSFDELHESEAPDLTTCPSAGCGGIVVDDGARTVMLTPGVRIDPGGIGKGLAADIVATELVERGAAGAMVNIGGDLRAVGCGPHNEPWTVSIDEPTVCASPLASVTFQQGAIATSVTTRRAWTVNGEPRHHVIDPRTGHPADTGVVLASTTAAEAWVAEAASKALLLGHSFSDLARTSGALVVVHSGDVELYGDFGASDE